MEDKTFETPPSPSNLITSLCSIGYDLNSAVADILDNSIAAGAKNIYVDFALHESKEVFLKIEDDGCGMKRLELLRAMRFGSFDPRQTRKISDLGQFGLGLKTASLSQSDRLVVRSKSDQEASCFEWNLDLVRKKDRWELIEHSNCLPEMRFRSEEQSLKSGTLVYWPEVKALRGKDKESFNASFMSLRRHLRLIFHRFLEDGDTNIWFQGQRLESLNPFNPDSMALIRRSPKIAWPPMPEQPKVTAETFLLSPEMLKVDSSLTEEEIYNMQGVYIYRSTRLISLSLIHI